MSYVNGSVVSYLREDILKIEIAFVAILKLGWGHFVPKLDSIFFFLNESLSHVQLFVTPQTIACKSMEFSRQEYWNG